MSVLRKPGFWLAAAVLAALAFNFFHPFDIQAPHITLAAEEVLRIGGLRVTNTLLASWLAMAVLIVVALLSTRNMQAVPHGLQNLVEAVLEALAKICEPTLGSRTPLVFPTIATLFLFIVVCNWMEILPGFASIVVTKAAEHGQALERVPLLRSAATDLNTTVALALSAVLMSQVYGTLVAGFPRYLTRFVNIRRFVAFFDGLRGRGPKESVSTLALGLLDLFVGLMELFDEFTKILSFSFRLFGNVFAGEVLLSVMVFLFPFVASLPFLGLELFVGAVQAFVFAVLATAFIAQATTTHHHAPAQVRQPVCPTPATPLTERS